MINSRQFSVFYNALFRVICFLLKVMIASYWITENAIPLLETIIGSLKWNKSLAKPYMKKFNNYFTQLRVAKSISF